MNNEIIKEQMNKESIHCKLGDGSHEKVCNSFWDFYIIPNPGHESTMLR